MIIFFLRDTIFESISALSNIGIFLLIASFISTLLDLIALDLTMIVALEIFFLKCP